MSETDFEKALRTVATGLDIAPVALAVDNGEIARMMRNAADKLYVLRRRLEGAESEISHLRQRVQDLQDIKLVCEERGEWRGILFKEHIEGSDTEEAAPHEPEPESVVGILREQAKVHVEGMNDSHVFGDRHGETYNRALADSLTIVADALERDAVRKQAIRFFGPSLRESTGDGS